GHGNVSCRNRLLRQIALSEIFLVKPVNFFAPLNSFHDLLRPIDFRVRKQWGLDLVHSNGILSLYSTPKCAKGLLTFSNQFTDFKKVNRVCSRMRQSQDRTITGVQITLEGQC